MSESLVLSDTPDYLLKINRNALGILGKILSASDISLKQVMRKYGLNKTSDLDLVDFLRLLEFLAIEVCDETLHLSKRALLPGTNAHVLSNLGASDSIQEALQTLAQSYNFIHGGAYNRVEARERELLYIIDDSQFPYAENCNPAHIHFSMDLVLLYVHGVVCALGGHAGANSLLKAQSRATHAEDSVLHAAFYHLPVKFSSSCYQLHYRITLAEQPLQWQAPLTLGNVYNQLQFHLGKNSKGSNLVSKVKNLLQQGTTSQELVASELGCSVATLRRKLADNNSSFRVCREQVLNREAKVLLLQRHTLEEVAQRLRFCDARSFNRAFKTWNGITPRDFIDAAMGCEQ